MPRASTTPVPPRLKLDCAGPNELPTSVDLAACPVADELNWRCDRLIADDETGRHPRPTRSLVIATMILDCCMTARQSTFLAKATG